MERYADYLVGIWNEQKQYLKYVVGLFVFGIVIGAIAHEAASAYIKDAISTLFGRFEDLRGVELFVRLFLNNLMASATGTASGILFGILPMISAFANGMVIGTVVTRTVQLTEMTSLQAVLTIVPHGIFEIPAFFLALALGLGLGTWPFRRDKTAYIAYVIRAAIGAYARIIIPLLLIAAAIETIAIELMRRSAG